MRSLSLFLGVLLAGTLAFGDELDDAMLGFDEPAAETALDEEALSGFDDEPSGSGLDEEALSGFEDEESIDLKSSENASGSDWYDVSGALGFLAAYNYAQTGPLAAYPGDQVMDFQGLSRARTKLDLALEMRHDEKWKSRIEVMGWYDVSWAIHGRDNYTETVLETYESFYDLKDAYIQGTLTPSLDIKIGRQVVIWGKSDSIRITDVINPLDNREPGMVDIEDLRLSETMTKLDYYFGDYSLSAMIIHEPRLEIESAFGSDYRPRDGFGETPYGPVAPDAIYPDLYQQGWEIENTQFALALDGRYEGWDLSWYAANVLSDRFSMMTEDDGTVLRTFEKIYMVGMATNIVSGAWLYKAEAAYIMDIDYRSVEDNKDRLDALLGVDYSGFTKTVLSLELADRHIFDYEEVMLQNTLLSAAPSFPDYVREDTVQLAARANYTFDHDNATLNYFIAMFGAGDFRFRDGGFQRLWMEYKLNDALTVNGGVVDYIGGDGTIPFYNAVKNNDRLFAELTYSF